MEIKISRTAKTVTASFDSETATRFKPNQRLDISFHPQTRTITLFHNENGTTPTAHSKKPRISGHLYITWLIRHEWKKWPQHGMIIVNDQKKINALLDGGALQILLPEQLPAARNLKRQSKSQVVSKLQLQLALPASIVNNLVMQVNDQTFGFNMPDSELLALALTLLKKGYAT